MKRRTQRAACIAYVFFLSTAATAQAPPDKPAAATTPPTFELADIHPSPDSSFSIFRGGVPIKGRYALRQGTLLDMIVLAYDVEPATVVGGPSWLDFDRFDVTAKVPPGTAQETTKLMLRALLADRFKLAVHLDTKPMPALLLTVSKGGSKMKPAADATADADCRSHRPSVPPGPGTPPPANYTITCHNMSMDRYVEDLRWMVGPHGGKPFVNATGLKGGFDFDITYTSRPRSYGGTGIPIEEALEKQLGLKIESGLLPQAVVFVDSVNETPTPNLPGIDKLLPPPPARAFDVATIKPSAPEGSNLPWRPAGPLQTRFTASTLQRLISFAYDINAGMIADGPAYFTKQRWDVLAKVAVDPPDAPPDGGSTPKPNQARQQSIDIEDDRAMLRALLAERFQLQAHFEDRPFDAYVLTAAGPKMKKADPANRTSCTYGPGPDGKDPRIANPILSELMTCRNITMSQFAYKLGAYAGDYITTPILNATNLDGAYDLTLSFSSQNAARNLAPTAPVGADTSTPASTSDPSGAISLPDALARQLGLKLQIQKRPVHLLVIDHLTENPTEN